MNPEQSDQTKYDIAALKTQVFVLIIATIVISSTLTVYLFRQSSLASKDLVQANKLNDLINQNESSLTNLISKLEVYGEKHPDFLPVLKKYGLVSTASTNTPAAPRK